MLTDIREIVSTTTGLVHRGGELNAAVSQALLIMLDAHPGVELSSIHLVRLHSERKTDQRVQVQITGRVGPL